MNWDFTPVIEDALERLTACVPAEYHGYTVQDSDVEVYIFSQGWGNTSGGMEGVGGQAMTSSYTVVVWDTYFTGSVAVYFGRFAYLIRAPNEEFFIDLQRQELKGFHTSKQGQIYEREA